MAGYRELTAPCWASIRQFFESLDPCTGAVAEGFLKRLLREVSPTGALEDAFSEPQTLRVLYLPIWFAEHYLGTQEPDLPQSLFKSAFYGAAAVRIYDDLVDGDQPAASASELPLANLLMRCCGDCLRPHYAADSPLWEWRETYWRRYTEALAAERQRQSQGLSPYQADDLRRLGDKGALLNVYAVAPAIAAGAVGDVDRIDELMGSLNVASQLYNDLWGIRQDITNANYTYPLTTAALSAGQGPGSHPTTGALSSALLLSGAITETSQLLVEHYNAALEVSQELGIRKLSSYLAWGRREVTRQFLTPEPMDGPEVTPTRS